jgi:hypothetical protein
VADEIVVNGEALTQEQYAAGIAAVADGSADYRWEVHHLLASGSSAHGHPAERRLTAQETCAVSLR